MRKLVLLLIIFSVSGLLAQGQPDRRKGISIHMLPKQVAVLGSSKWGLQVDYAPHLKPEREQPVLQSLDEFIEYVKKQDKSVQENGVWIVTTHPDSYSNEEHSLLQSIEKASGREHILLFVCRASELPNGWKRYGQ